MCAEFRSLDQHLFELASFCEYLGNNVEYATRDGSSLVSTDTVGKWLKLAAQLESVDINTWKFSDSSPLYCETVADAYDSDTKHFSNYSTVLTKFIFVSNALEEVYRFIVPAYERCEQSKMKKYTKPSMKATALLDTFDVAELPHHFFHKIDSLVSLVNNCHLIKEKQFTGMKGANSSDHSYGLHLVRNIRNFVAHGVFPITTNPDWDPDNESTYFIPSILLSACRVSSLSIQALLSKYNHGMDSYEYERITHACGEEFDYFLKHCKPEISLKLHLEMDFSFRDPFGYGC
jgi:hypothetical protein